MKLFKIIRKIKLKDCPHCGRQIAKDAIRCKWCYMFIKIPVKA